MSTNTVDGSVMNREMERVLLQVIQSLHDAQRGFAEVGEHLKDEALKRFFLAESLKRANFAGELENELHRTGMADVKEAGSVAGALHRAWGDVQARFGAGDHALLATAEQGEDEAKKAYVDALEQDLPFPVRQLLTEQQSHVVAAHDFVRNTRDKLAAK